MDKLNYLDELVGIGCLVSNHYGNKVRSPITNYSFTWATSVPIGMGCRCRTRLIIRPKIHLRSRSISEYLVGEKLAFVLGLPISTHLRFMPIKSYSQYMYIYIIQIYYCRQSLVKLTLYTLPEMTYLYDINL